MSLAGIADLHSVKRERSFISWLLEEVVPTSADMPAGGGYGQQRRDVQEAWQRAIDYKLIEWGKNPEMFDDEGVDPPSREAIRQAVRVAQDFNYLPPPDSVVPDANGGIVFERRQKDVSETIHVWGDGSVEYFRFQGTCLVERRPLIGDSGS